jgi:hypothetical protein
VHPSSPLRPAGTVLSPEVSDALDAGRPVVALESTLLAHGLPRPDNRAAADDVEAAVRAGRLDYLESGRLLRFYEDGLHGYTYLEDPNDR